MLKAIIFRIEKQKRNDLKAYLAKRGTTMQEHFSDYVDKLLKKQPQKKGSDDATDI